MISAINASSPVSASSSASSSSASSATAANVNYNQFLQLLIAEMKNQDPTNPMDPTQTVSQLATFSGVEQQVQTNTTLDNLMAGFNFSNPSTPLSASGTSSASASSSSSSASSSTGA